MGNLRARAATPATVFLLASFALLLLSTISVPITKSISLGSSDGVDFGVFGYCVNGKCSSVQLGYNPDAALAQAGVKSPKRSILLQRDDSSDNSPQFTLPSSTRNGLSDILVVHPIAAGLNLILLILCVIAHVRSPSHSTRYLLCIFIATILTTLITMLAFLVDILLFVPHFAFGTWLVLAATICSFIATVLLCCGRRTLIGRKAMRKRIDENAEMSGQNYFQQAAQDRDALDKSSTKIPEYAEFEVERSTRSPERIPLNQSQTHLMMPVVHGRTGSDRSGGTASTENASIPGGRIDGPLRSGPSPYHNGVYAPGGRMPRPYANQPQLRGMVPPSERSFNGVPRPSPDSMGINRLPPPRSDGNMVRPNDSRPMNDPVREAESEHQSSVYSDYIPPRSNWGQPVEAGVGMMRRRADFDPGDHDRYRSEYRPERPSINTQILDRGSSSRNVMDNPYIAPAKASRLASAAEKQKSGTRRQSDTVTIASYYEDVDPRFDGQADSRHIPDELDDPNRREDYYSQRSPVTPRGGSKYGRGRPEVGDTNAGPSLRRNYSSESLQNGQDDIRGRDGPRSPAASTSSHFTSVSQRGINPRWRPGYDVPPPVGGGKMGEMMIGGYSDIPGPPPRTINGPRPGPGPRRNDGMNLLAGNPDFELPVRAGGMSKRPISDIPPMANISSADTGRYPVPR